MESAFQSRPAHPTYMNLGSGKDFRDDFLNIDVDDTWAPDAVCDLSRVKAEAGVSLKTARFGDITLMPGSLDGIVANDVLEHVPDLMGMMTTCLTLLRVGGLFKVSVPYDLSYGAWQDPTHVRAFNERSWLYYTEWFWYMGWSEFRFDLKGFDFVPSPLGESLRARNVARDDILRTPRAVDSMTVGLQKIALTPADRRTWEHWRDRKRAAQNRQSAQAPVAARPSIVPAAILAATGPDAVAPPASTALKAFAGDLPLHRDRYALWIVTPPNYTHQHGLDDVAAGLSEAFAELGGSAPVIRNPADREGRSLIILGAHLLSPEARTAVPADAILFNLEQADGSSAWMNGPYPKLLRERPVLDFSIRNQAALALLGMPHARVLPIGYASCLTRIRPAPEKDIDVLFYGSLNDRRRLVLEALEKRGVKAVHLFDVYGTARDEAISRAKIVLNLHFYEAAIFESVRVSLLLANGACVVTEGFDRDPDLAPLVGGMAIVPYAELVDRCLSLLADPAARAALGRAGFEAIKRQRQSALLQSMFEV